MSQFKVANLPNLFWDNGSFKYPSTFPRLLNAKPVNKTPVMTSPISGWVVLEGEWNYCEFLGELFFLKKDRVISHKRNKWVYVLIKDHICSLFKNKAGVIAKGVLTTTDIDNLGRDDYQFTFPTFSNYNRKILLPLVKTPFNWRTACDIKPITKTFDTYYPVDDESFSNFVAILEANRDLFTKSPDKLWTEAIKNNEHLVLLGRLGHGKDRVKGWKQELVEKINALLKQIPARKDVLLGVISNDVITNATKIVGRYAISYSANNPLFSKASENREIDIDLSGLTDIELINFDNPSPGEKYAKDHFNLFLTYSVDKVSKEFRDYTPTFIHKLHRRIRIPFLNEYSTRAIVKYGGRHYPFCWKSTANSNTLFLPQKLFFKNPDKLTLREEGTETARRYHQYKQDNYRSVYLYWCWNLNFYFAWGDRETWKGESGTKLYEANTWINNLDYFKDNNTQNILRSVSDNYYFYCSNHLAIEAIPCINYESNKHRYLEIGSRELIQEQYSSYYPWSTLDPINIGWLVGQFSTYISGQENAFETKFPFVVKVGVGTGRTLKRIKGLKNSVSTLVHMNDLFQLESRSNVFTLDIFNPLSRRMRETNKEEDFLIGEKLLFSTWGMAPYLLFQPACLSIVSSEAAYGILSKNIAVYGYYNGDDLDNYYQPQLFFKWLEPASWHYVYSVFDSGSYFKQNAKRWYKKAYQDYAPLTPYKRFYSSKTNYKTLVQHAIKNTGAYFETEEVNFSTNPIGELKVNDIFYSDEEWYWRDASEGKTLGPDIAGEFLEHAPSLYGREKQLLDDDIVAYLNPKDKKVYLGKVNAFTDRVTLPAGQYIAIDNQISSDSSTVNYLDVRYTRISPVTENLVIADTSSGFESIDVLINSLKQSRYLKQIRPTSLKQLQDQGRSYLFNLKGTPFFCVFDRLGRVSLIFKNKEKYEESEHIPN